MMSNNQTYTISEYGLIGIDKSVESYNKFKSQKVDTKAYSEFEAFAKTEYGKNILSFSGNGRYLQAKNYVGTIQTKSGYSLEILPKVYSDEQDEEKSKKIFIELLKLLYKLPSFKHVEKAKFQSEKMPLLEIFISMFLEEIGDIIQKGIKSDYIAHQENLYYLKGKLLLSEQLKRNSIHRERFFVDYDEYSSNRVENRVLKSTLKYLLSISASFENIRLLRMYHEHFYGVDYSLNIDHDFQRLNTVSRGMRHYSRALIWAKIFLKKESFSSFSGETIAFSILYPMEKLFENYVEHKLIEQYPKYSIITQNGEQSFVHKYKGKKLFGMRPDIIIKEGEKLQVVVDAKWKILENESSFNQSDFYQLFAYHHIYKPEKALRLYYPKSEYLSSSKKFEFSDKSKILVIPIDMDEIVNKG